jgi:tripartite-type tricarboxylate transporter receptor subunit TctC
LVGKTIRWIVPFPPGGSYDIYSRLLEPFVEELLQAEIVVENVPGAAGVVAAEKLRARRPDGLTLGIQNATGLLVAAMTDRSRVPNPVTDFTVLGRFNPIRMVWFTGANSRFRSIDAVLEYGRSRPIVFGLSEAASSGLVHIAVSSEVLQVQSEFVLGFSGSRETSLAAVRGDLDVICFPLDSVMDRVEAGELRPLLRIETDPRNSHTLLDGVPCLGGQSGVALQLTRSGGGDVDHVNRMVDALTDLGRAGRVIAAPPAMQPDLQACLHEHLQAALSGAEFRRAAAAANRPLEVADGPTARAHLRAASSSIPTLAPSVRRAMRRIRG